MFALPCEYFPPMIPISSPLCYNMQSLPEGIPCLLEGMLQILIGGVIFTDQEMVIATEHKDEQRELKVDKVMRMIRKRHRSVESYYKVNLS